MSKFLLGCTVLLLVHVACASKKLPGHLKHLGAHQTGKGITMIGKFSRAPVFYGHFIKHNKPLWMRSALEYVKHPGLDWTDQFLRKKYGDLNVKVEVGKKEDRTKRPTSMTLSQFLNSYKTNDLYLVQTLNDKMEELVYVPECLHCGGLQKVIQEAVIWLGSGKAKSVLHYDDLDNILCLLDGKKNFFLVDKAFKSDVEADGFVQSEGYSLVDVDKVDFEKFPRLANIEWYQANLSKGDCLYVPKGWYHQVTSSGVRHLAINLWFAHVYWFDPSNCSIDQDYYKLIEPITKFGFASPNESYRSKLLEHLVDKELLFKDVVISSLGTSTEERRGQFFDAIDKYKDNVLSWGELYGFDIDKAISKFPDIFGLPGSWDYKSDDVLYDPIVEQPFEEPLASEESTMSASSQPLPDDTLLENNQPNIDESPLEVTTHPDVVDVLEAESQDSQKPQKVSSKKEEL
ncbi:bifunctional peptidase and arginyl-hydroxylase JMJD5-like isoform X2 [Physella acuta]|nr:bifunctional peptidase and arginyl-hydroxylase JMJD5-like isoform X2 [Physella acuta]XP_059152928.1 bifunctional peptidase and arginyl-hydroxylase JMJD5-like isoform X2 [Physella acuta]